MPEIKVTPLGAGQDVGRSCILLSMGGKNIMLDCGMHMGYNDEKKFPDFSYISKESLTECIDCVIISHFHLDHCGALPYMTEMVGYDGPIYMTCPTKAICPVLLEDMRKIATEKRGEKNFFTSEMIKNCMKKVKVVSLHETVVVDDDLEIKAYYAGHVLGAAMFAVRVGQRLVVYTGDYNTTPDRHLGAAWIDKCRPDLLITESTYATTIRDSKRCRERDFLRKVHDTVEAGGKVLIPVFALGRVQELCILLETYWERMDLKVPIYFTAGMALKATNYYKLFITWTSQKIKETFVERNLFEFKHIKTFDKSLTNQPGPMVVFATPGMLHAGQSLNIFKQWAPDPNNMLIMPGYCVKGTVGSKVLGGAKSVDIEGKKIDVNMSVQYMSFSAHADAKGIMQTISQVQPRHVMLVHGEAGRMDFLKEKIKQEFGIDCENPPNGLTVLFKVPEILKVKVSRKLIEMDMYMPRMPINGILTSSTVKRASHQAEQQDLKLLDCEDATTELRITPYKIKHSATLVVTSDWTDRKIAEKIYQMGTQLVDKKHLQMVADISLTVMDIIVTVMQRQDNPVIKDVIMAWDDENAKLGMDLFNFVLSIPGAALL